MSILFLHEEFLTKDEIHAISESSTITFSYYQFPDDQTKDGEVACLSTQSNPGIRVKAKVRSSCDTGVILPDELVFSSHQGHRWFLDALTEHSLPRQDCCLVLLRPLRGKIIGSMVHPGRIYQQAIG